MAGRDACAGAQHDSTSATTPGGTPRSASAATDGRLPRSPHTCAFSIPAASIAFVGAAAVISASYGCNPLSTCHAITPKLYTSLAVVMLALPSSRTGSMYTSVPRSPSSVPRVFVPARRCTLLPKSASLATGKGDHRETPVSSTLSGFTSPWMTELACRYAKPPATFASNANRSSMSAP